MRRNKNVCRSISITFPTPNGLVVTDRVPLIPLGLPSLPVMVKDKRAKRTCLCGCGSTSSSTKARHNRATERPILRKTLDLAHAMARISPKDQVSPPLPGPSNAAGSSRSHLPLAPDLTTHMDVDENEVQGSLGRPTSPTTSPQTPPDILSRVWTNREGRVERQDENLFSRSPSPLPGSLESGGGQGLNDDEVELSDLSSESEEEEPQTSVHLTATRQLDTEFELQAARAGMCSRFLRLLISRLCWKPAQRQLDPEDLNDISAFNIHVTHSTTEACFEDVRSSLSHRTSDPHSLYETQKRIAQLSGLYPEYSDCCINICCCFTGKYERLDRCPFTDCQEPRYDAAGKPRLRFQHLPVGPRLQALFRNKDTANLLRYRSNHTSKTNRNKVSDVFDGSLYRELCEQYVKADGISYSHKYFEDPRDIALGLSLDGFPIFNKRNQSAWPIILINFNLPPDVRTHLVHILCYGVIPAPTAVKDTDSFLYPLYCELVKLATGISTLDLNEDELFLLRVFLILVFGDMPAIAKVMRMKGHNGFCPCRVCEILGIRHPEGKVYYVPLSRPQGNESYDATTLPKRTHQRFLQQAGEVVLATTNAEEDRLSTKYGIKGIPLLSLLGSLSFPSSFPLDFMHLIFENLVPNLIGHYTGSFKDLNCGSESYELAPDVWSAICRAGAESGKTIPSSFGARMPNIEKERKSMTADSWSFWAQYIGPIVLRNHFRKDRYYKHFTDLTRLIKLCLNYDMELTDIEEIRRGFAEWVVEYEQ